MNSENSHCGVVAVIGAPNAGKSTLVNALVGQKVAITSAKAQTTRARLLGIALEYAQGRMGLGRAMDVRDALANTLGVLAGLATQFTPLRDLLLRFDTRVSRST